MQNDGEKIYALSKAYNIDVVFLLGFFYNESTCGTAGASVANHSVGNIICHAQFTCKYDRFAYYDTWIDSVDDWFNLIKNSDYYIKAGHLTLSTIVPIYAPSSDNNDVENYINTVLTEVKMMRTRQYDNIS